MHDDRYYFNPEKYSEVHNVHRRCRGGGLSLAGVCDRTVCRTDGIEVGDCILAQKITLETGSDLKSGDIVVFKNPRPRNGVDILVKRVIATSGQTVDLKDGKVYVDGRRLDESYAMGESKPLDAHLSSAPDSYPYTIPDGCIWVMGDNRENSADSRYFGPVEEDSVIGIVFARYFPFDRIGSVS